MCCACDSIFGHARLPAYMYCRPNASQHLRSGLSSLHVTGPSRCEQPDRSGKRVRGPAGTTPPVRIGIAGVARALVAARVGMAASGNSGSAGEAEIPVSPSTRAFLSSAASLL